MRPDAVMLFAAGFGTRMRPLTATRPKPLIKVSGRPLIDYALDQVREYDAAQIVCNLHYLAEVLEAHLANTNILLSREEPDILDTGGGLKAAIPLLDRNPVFTMNTDAVWRGPNPLTYLADIWNPENMDALLLCVPKANAVGHAGAGDFQIGPQNRAERGPGVIYTGLQIIKTDVVSVVPDSIFSLNLVWDQLMSDQRLCGASYPGQWCDVGSPSGIKLAEELLEHANG